MYMCVTCAFSAVAVLFAHWSEHLACNLTAAALAIEAPGLTHDWLR